jgi:hypothetical protein
MRVLVQDHEQNRRPRRADEWASIARCLANGLDGLPQVPTWARPGRYELGRDQLLAIRDQHAEAMWAGGPFGEHDVRRANSEDRWWVVDGNSIAASEELIVDVLDFVVALLGVADRVVIVLSDGT